MKRVVQVLAVLLVLVAVGAGVYLYSKQPTRQGHVGVVHGNHHQPRALQAHRTEQRTAPAIAVMHAAVFAGGFLHPFRVVIQGDKRLLFVAQKTPDGLPDAAIPANHCVPAQFGVECGDFLQLHLLVGFTVQAQGDARCGAQ